MTEGDRERLGGLATSAWARRATWLAHPDRFADDPAVAEIAEAIRAGEQDEVIAILEWARDDMGVGPDAVVITVCLGALPTAGESPEVGMLAGGLIGFGPRQPPVTPLALAVLTTLSDAPPPLLSDLMMRVPDTWVASPPVGRALVPLVERLVAEGDEVDLAAFPPWHGQGPHPVVRTLDQVALLAGGPAGHALSATATRLALQSAAAGFLRVREASPLPAGLVEVPQVAALAREIADTIDREPPGSVVVSGAPGSGRSTLMEVAAHLLGERGWTVLEGRPEEVAAGQVYVNELEGRLQRLATACRGRRVVWLAPSFDSALTVSRASGDPRSLADRLATFAQTGAFATLAEITPETLSALPRESPALAPHVRAASVPALEDADLVRVAASAVAAEAAALEARAPEAAERVLAAAVTLSRHLLSHLAQPGAVVRLVRAATAECLGRGATAVAGDDLFAGLSALTGMPRAVLDDAERLDVDAMRAWFTSRVLGQPEAVEALVERVTLIKAGLADPLRPYGTLLFVGPTGTGKTELARALAEYLFGAPERMVRIDMSELKTPDTLPRLTSAGGVGGSLSLASRIRAQPFSVVLLDEFEKAHPQVWDLFLQVFDAGRLTDADGRTVDFRQTIVIVTSNLGSAVGTGRGFGFVPGDSDGGFSPERVERAVREALRPELVNRFDRVVVFRPLSREVMRAIVQGEITAVLGRRGIAQRDWAIEVDGSAVEFLLERGFTTDMGARPLRRAVERHLLVPLARAIVTHEAPRGEQFLLVDAGERELQVTFVAADDTPAAPEEPAGGGAASVEEVAREPRGTRDELHLLHERLDVLRQATRTGEWTAAKDAALAATSEPGFWERDDRFHVLGRAESMDRVEGQVRASASLLDRLFALTPTSEVRVAREPIARVARRLVQIGRALDTLRSGGDQDALVLVQPAEGSEAFADQITGMYEAWARAAGATSARLAAPAGIGLLLQGLGVHASLEAETGLHVQERSSANRTRRIGSAHVAVGGWDAGAGGDPAEAVAGLAPAPGTPVVRRYQGEPTPLVRDRARGWRTGRLDRVLAGDFDLF